MDKKNILTEGQDKLDIDTGYFTRKSFTYDSEAVSKYENTVTQLIVDSKKKVNGRVWYLTTITLPAGILFPDGTKHNYEWVVAPVAAIDTGDAKKYPIPGQHGQYYETRVAVEDAKKFKTFKEALLALGML